MINDDLPKSGKAFALIQERLDQMAEAQRALDIAKVAVKALPKQIKALDLDELEIEMIASYLYWAVQIVTATDIAEGLLDVKPHQVRDLVYPLESDVPCKDCGKPILVYCRAELANARSHRAHQQCQDCDRRASLISQARFEKALSAQEQRLHELKTMPYQEYLQSPEWATKRTAALRVANYRCQICNSNKVKLNVHHRTYANRGNEDRKDLVVLCENCHGLFHSNGKLDRD